MQHIEDDPEKENNERITLGDVRKREKGYGGYAGKTLMSTVLSVGKQNKISHHAHERPSLVLVLCTHTHTDEHFFFWNMHVQRGRAFGSM